MAKRVKKLLTLAELAEHLGAQKGTVGGWVRNPEWKWPRLAPWNADDKPEMLTWAAEMLDKSRHGGRPRKTNPDGELPLRTQKLEQEIRKLRAQADQAIVALDRERGKLLEADEVSAQWSAVGIIVRNQLQNLPSQIIPLALTHGIPHEAADKFRSQIDEIIRGTLRNLSQIDDDPENKEEILPESISA